MTVTAAADTSMSSLVDVDELFSVRRGQYSIVRIPTAITTARMTATIRLRSETGISFKFFYFPGKRAHKLDITKAAIQVSAPIYTYSNCRNREEADGRSKNSLEQLMIISDRTVILL